MEGKLKVTPERLLTASAEFNAAGIKIKGLTVQMMESIRRVKGIWQGEAADTYQNKFYLLQSDMDKMHRMLQEHVEDLQEMARKYQEAEQANIQEGYALNSDVIL